MLPEALVTLVNTALMPWAPDHGSLGASGRLAPSRTPPPVFSATVGCGAGGGAPPGREALPDHGINFINLASREG
jgi:histidine ammonia-lyase